jgi:hypothetical protein
LTGFVASPLQWGTKTPNLTGTSDVLRKFDQDTKLVTRVVLSLVLVTAAVFGCGELVQTESVHLNVADTVRATDKPQETQLTSSTPPETSYRPVETPASNPTSPRAPSSRSNPIDTQITMSQRSLEPVAPPVRIAPASDLRIGPVSPFAVALATPSRIAPVLPINLEYSNPAVIIRPETKANAEKPSRGEQVPKHRRDVESATAARMDREKYRSSGWSTFLHAQKRLIGLWQGLWHESLRQSGGKERGSHQHH